MRKLSNLERYRKRIDKKASKSIDRLLTLEYDIKDMLYRLRDERNRLSQLELDKIKRITEDMINT